MIEEIKKLRRKGLSFRKIADELDVTIGKVQYQWKKHKKNEESEAVHRSEGDEQPKQQYDRILRTRFWTKQKLVSFEHLTAWLIAKNKLFIFWELLEVKKELVSDYFNRPFNSYPKVLKIYDVTHILFNGSNAHHVQEIILKDGQGESLLKELQPNRCYITELGIKRSENEFFPLLRSNAVHIPRTERSKAGNLKKEVDQYLQKKNSLPHWVEHVSTYSYYERILNRDDE